MMTEMQVNQETGAGSVDSSAKSEIRPPKTRCVCHELLWSRQLRVYSVHMSAVSCAVTFQMVQWAREMDNLVFSVAMALRYT